MWDPALQSCFDAWSVHIRCHRRQDSGFVTSEGHAHNACISWHRPSPSLNQIAISRNEAMLRSPGYDRYDIPSLAVLTLTLR